VAVIGREERRVLTGAVDHAELPAQLADLLLQAGISKIHQLEDALHSGAAPIVKDRPKRG